MANPSKNDERGSFFESINLASEITDAKALKDKNPEVSDVSSLLSDEDDLDPTEFLSPENPSETLQHPRNITTASLAHQHAESNSSNKDHSTNSLPRIDVSEGPILQNDNTLFSNPSMLIYGPTRYAEPSAGEAESVSNVSRLFNMTSSSILKDSLLKESPRINDALKFLHRRLQTIRNRLLKHVDMHHQMLSDGNSGLMKIRLKIVSDFEETSEVYQSLQELYSRDMDHTSQLMWALRQWDVNRSKVLDKIRRIKSDKNDHGTKLTLLLDESNAVNLEIIDLERRLQSLHSRKNLLNTEIEETSSVLESKTAKYVDSFKRLEADGRNSIEEILLSRGLRGQELEQFLKEVKVNVTFSRNYEKFTQARSKTDTKNKEEEQGTQIFNHANPLPKSHDFNHVYDNNGITIDNFMSQHSHDTVSNDKHMANESDPVFEDSIVSPRKDLHKSPVRRDPDASVVLTQNFVPETSAFESGHLRGLQQVSRIKEQISEFLNSIKPSHSYGNPSETDIRGVKIDDSYNTINSKLNLEPISELLKLQYDATHSAVLGSSKKAVLFHKFSVVWSDIVSLIQSNEENISSNLTDSIYKGSRPDDNILSMLRTALIQIKASVTPIFTTEHESASVVKSKKILRTVVLNEIKAINSGIELVDGHQNTDQKLVPFLELGFTSQELFGDSEKTSRKSFSRSSSMESLFTDINSPQFLKSTPSAEINNTNHFVSEASMKSNVLNEKESFPGKFDLRRNLSKMTNLKQMKKE